ncbi:hypothetical protein ACHAXT_000851 [Thalassiosira profunda]
MGNPSKRRFGSSGGRGGPPHPTPRRGPPAVFVTCESGREGKCRREALELLHHYYYASRPGMHADGPGENEAAAKGDATEDRSLSLEEELALLRKGAAAEEVLSYESDPKRQKTANGTPSKKNASSMKSPFSVYDVGNRGMVCILCTLPGCEMVPYDDILAEIRASKETGGDATKPDAGDSTKAKEDAAPGGKHPMTKSNDGAADEIPDALWDPVETVRCILRDAKPVDKDADGAIKSGGESDEKDCQNEASVSNGVAVSPPPGSRFISRILPVQATCYSSVEEIKAVSMSLLKRCLPKCEAILSKEGKEVTFKLEIKRRLCSHLKRDDVIEAVTPLVLGGMEEMPGYKFSVNLSDPDFSIRVETVKGLCGISVLPREIWHRNFNLAELINPSADNTQQS